MRKLLPEFIRRGLLACGFGPIILAVVYLILYNQGVVVNLRADQVCIGIFSLSALAFIAGGMNVIYQVERIPLMVSVLLHGVVLYASYLFTYLINDWLELGITPILIFSAIFVIGYLVIWMIIYFVIKRNTEKINEIINKTNKSK